MTPPAPRNGHDTIPARVLIAAHVQVGMVGATVGEAMHQPGIAVKVEDDGFIYREQAVELAVG